MSVYYTEPMRIELKGRSLFVNGEVKEFTTRNLSDLNGVLRKKMPAPILHDFPIYFMFREIIAKNGMRYDITLMPPKLINGEYAKTYGHFHPPAEPGLSYPEAYQVLEGSALFVLQKMRSDESCDVMVTYGEKGQVVLIPPNWGHVTVNASKDKLLVLSNVVADSFKSEYAKYSQNRGAAYYITDFGLEQNENYVIRETEKKKADEINARYGFRCEDLLREFTADAGKFEFLKKPSLIMKPG